jgi:Domain of unknown function (DUF4136)
MKKHSMAFLFVLLMGVAVLLVASVKTDYDHQADFARYRTYSWLRVQAGNQLWQDRITRDVDNALQEKGWRKVASGGDASVSAFGSTKNEETLQTFYDGFGGGWFWRGFGPETATTTVETTQVGTLTVDIFDSHSKHLIWRGNSTNTLSGNPEKNDKKIESNVQDYVQTLPAELKGLS